MMPTDGKWDLTQRLKGQLHKPFNLFSVPAPGIEALWSFFSRKLSHFIIIIIIIVVIIIIIVVVVFVVVFAIVFSRRLKFRSH